MRAWALYARVSTTDQTCENQFLELRRYVAARGWTIHREYVDQGVSGTKDRHVALDSSWQMPDGGGSMSDKGYHSNQTLVDLATLDLRTYIAEPDRGRRNWTHQAAARDAVYANRRRIRGVRGLAWSSGDSIGSGGTSVIS